MIDLSDIHRFVPFLGLAAAEKNRPLLTRLVEQSLPGIMVAALGLYINDVKQDEKIDTLGRQQTQQIEQVKDQITTLRTEFHEMRRDLYEPRRLGGNKQ